MTGRRPVLRPSPERAEPIIFQSRLDGVDAASPAEALTKLAEVKEMVLRGDNIVAGFEAADPAHGVALLITRKIETAIVVRNDVEAEPNPAKGLYDVTAAVHEDNYVLHLAGAGKQRLGLYHLKDDEKLVPDGAFGAHDTSEQYESASFELDEATGRSVMRLMDGKGNEAVFSHFEMTVNDAAPMGHAAVTAAGVEAER